ncbi:MAG: SDR family NAD(P)-dependent oxidoreductase [Parahaliea sp.]
MNTPSEKTQAPVVLVTGATGGLGSAICHAFAREGARVLALYRSSYDKAQALCASLEGDGHRPLQAAIDDSAVLNEVAQEVARDYGRLDCLVNNAGMTRYVPHEDLPGLDDQLIDDIFRTNWRGPFACIRAFQPLLARSGRAAVVNISSIAAQTGMGSNVAYCASKAALDSMTRSLARALAPTIRVLSVAPGLIDTEFVKGLDPEWRDHQVKSTPLQRLAHPDEVAKAVVLAASDLTFTTGISIPVDGGRPLG